MKQVLNIELIKREGKLIPKSLLAKEQYRLFIASLTDGEEISCLLDVKEGPGSKGQLSKIHMCIAEMAKEQGHTVLEMKNLVKHECGYDHKDGEYESFKGKSKEELSTVIETIIQMGNFMGINFEQMR